MTQYNYSDRMKKGLFAYYWGVINALNHINPETDKLYVNLSKLTPYYDPNYTITDNVWEYYFEQPYDDYDFSNMIASDFTTFCPDPSRFLFGLDGCGNYSLSLKSPNSSKSRILGKELTNKFIRFKPHILKKVDDFFNQNMTTNTLGIQYRGGEAFHTAHGKNQSHKMSIEYHISKIDENLNTGKYDKLFLITNDQYARDILMSHYEGIITKYDMDLLCPVGMHICNAWLHNDRNYDKGEFAVIDCILLSRCKKILATSSNLTCLSTLLTESECEFIDEHIYYTV